jgi:hypothetical protein
VFKLAFILKSVHLAHMALKDEQIAALRNDLSVARTDRLRSETARDVAVAKAFELLTPKPAEVVRPEARIRTPQPAPPPTLDLAEVDPTDNDAIRDLALAEMPAGKGNATLLMSKMESIRNQVYAAKAAKVARSREIGRIDAPTAPQHVIDAIEVAIAQGKQQARTN